MRAFFEGRAFRDGRTIVQIQGSLVLALSAATIAGCSLPASESVSSIENKPAIIAPLEGADWELVWADEFEGDALDRSKWTPEESCWGGGNQERQCYTDRPENIVVENGSLLLRARKEKFSGPARPPEIAETPNLVLTQEYTSGKVRTRGLHAWKYGRIEMRAKVPGGQGVWPAFWMMPNEDYYGNWALSGEIDIFEGFNLGAKCKECDTGRQNRTVSALHFGGLWPDNLYVDQWTRFPGDALPTEDFHVYSVEWAQGLIRFLVNDRVHLTVTADQWNTASQLGEGNPNAPFDQPFYVMMNLAIGGEKIESTNEKGVASDAVPAQFEIDWVRVYQCKDDVAKGRACIK